MKLFVSIVTLLVTCQIVLSAEKKVVSLHPLVTDLIEQIAGDRVDVINLLGSNSDPHHFQPTPADILKAKGAKLYFFSGMGLETYLKDLRSTVPADTKFIEVGATLPSLYGACDHGGHDHPSHKHDLDPHWWHSVDHFRRAAKVVTEALSDVFSEDAMLYAKTLDAYLEELDSLDRWIRSEVSKIPKNQRLLVTSHSAFQYFCNAYGFETLAIQGINREQKLDAKSLTKLLKKMKKRGVNVVFSEVESNPKMLKTLIKDTGIVHGGTLIADGRGATNYEVMMRKNVSTIVKGLTPK